MLKKIIHRLLKHRHPWRDISFNELSELYIASLMRSASISMTGIFVPIYLYRLHYSITMVAVVFASYFTARVFLDTVTAFTVARIGPKHTMVIGQFLQIASSALFLTLPWARWPLWFVGCIWGSSASFYFIPFHVDFSKIKHKVHGGKELGFEQIMEKIGLAIGPLMGGLIATAVGERYIFLFSIVVLLAGLWPLFRTGEPVRVQQKLRYSDLTLDRVKGYILPYIGLNIENTLCLMLWPLFLAVVVLPGSSVYAKVGLLASVSVVASIATAYMAGRRIDNHQGRPLLRISAVVNGLLHLCRPFVSIYPVAFGANVLNEVVTIGYRLPFTKGFYDATDDLPGYRIVFISSMETIGCCAKATAWWVLVMMSTVLATKTFFICGFTIASIASFLITTEKFKALGAKGA